MTSQSQKVVKTYMFYKKRGNFARSSVDGCGKIVGKVMPTKTTMHQPKLAKTKVLASTREALAALRQVKIRRNQRRWCDYIHVQQYKRHNFKIAQPKVIIIMLTRHPATRRWWAGLLSLLAVVVPNGGNNNWQKEQMRYISFALKQKKTFKCLCY